MRNFVNSELHLGALATLNVGTVIYCMVWRLNDQDGWIGFAAALIMMIQATTLYLDKRLTGFSVAMFYLGGFGVLVWLFLQR